MRLRECDRDDVLTLATCGVLDQIDRWTADRALAITNHQPYWICFYDERIWECEMLLDRLMAERGRL